jgi:hypothetical protein
MSIANNNQMKKHIKKEFDTHINYLKIRKNTHNLLYDEIINNIYIQNTHAFLLIYTFIIHNTTKHNNCNDT